MEFVYVVPRDELFPERIPHGLQLFGEGFEPESLLESLERHGHFVERSWAEGKPTVKQIIPYSVVVRDGEVLLLRRTRAGGEARLHEKLSIGVGGHVNPIDAAGASGSSARSRGLLARATRREIGEELELGGPYDVRAVGILNDDTDPVGAVHLGWVQVVNVDGPVAIRETDQLEGRFVSGDALRDLEAGGANFESWSRWLIRHLDHIQASAEVGTGPTLEKVL